MPHHTIVDESLLAGAAPAPAALHAPEALLLPRNPGVGMLLPEDWVDVARQLRLSGREFCVAVLIFEGSSHSQVARQLKCAASTVRIHIDRLFAKLNVEDRLAMVLRVMRVHLALVARRPLPPVSQKDATCVRK